MVLIRGDIGWGWVRGPFRAWWAAVEAFEEAAAEAAGPSAQFPHGVGLVHRGSLGGLCGRARRGWDALVAVGKESGRNPGGLVSKNEAMLGPDETELFREVQLLHQNLIVRIVLPFSLLVMVLVVLPLAFRASGGPDAVKLIVFALFGVGLPVGLMMLRLVTVVTNRRLLIRFVPFPGRSIDLDQITHAEAVRYNPIADCGGWGWRFSLKYHRVFNISGDRGVHVRYGERRPDQFLVGSRRAEELAEAIELARFDAGPPAA